MKIDLRPVVSAMLKAVRSEVADRWPAARPFVEGELRKLADTFADVQTNLAEGKMDLTGARALIRMQENCALSAMQLVEGVSVLTSRRAIGAAMRAAATLINPIIGEKVIQAGALKPVKKSETPTSPSSEPGPKKQKAVAATRTTGRALSTTAASTESAEEATPSFKAGKDL